MTRNRRGWRPAWYVEHMETILNLVWLGVTLIVICLWRFRWHVSRPAPRHSARTEAVAVICFIAFVFPVISLTDDLHPEIVAVDAVGGKRNSCLMVASARPVRSAASNPEAHVTLAVLLRPFASVTFATTRICSPVQLRVPASLAGAFLGRSPPSLF